MLNYDINLSFYSTNKYSIYSIQRSQYSPPLLSNHYRPPLGRRPTTVSPEKKKEALQDERDRNAIEGKFGQAKRRFSLNRVMTKLPDTSETAIAITFLVINLSALLRQALRFFWLFQKMFLPRLYLVS